MQHLRRLIGSLIGVVVVAFIEHLVDEFLNGQEKAGHDIGWLARLLASQSAERWGVASALAAGLLFAFWPTVRRWRTGSSTVTPTPASQNPSEAGYEEEITETLAQAAGQGGLMIFTYVLSFSLIIHPRFYRRDQFSEEQERAIVDSARDSTGTFPIRGTADAVNLNDGFQVTTVLPRQGDALEYREYYRFRRDGLFVLTRVSPDDIDEDRQFRGNDRYIRLTELISTLTSMAIFAAALVSAYGDDATGTIQISGMANHHVVNDMSEEVLWVGDLPPSHQDRVVSDFSGSPREFERARYDWSAEAIAKCLRALNVPATTETIKGRVLRLQQAVQ